MDPAPALSTGPASGPPSLPVVPELAFLIALWDAWQALTARGETELRARHDLDLRAFIALAYVQGGADQPAQLARELGVPRYEVSRVLHLLEGRGAVARTQTQADARRVTVSVTAQGAELWEAALNTVRAVTAPPLGALGCRLEFLTRDLHALAEAARALPHPSALPYPSAEQEPK